MQGWLAEDMWLNSVWNERGYAWCVRLPVIAHTRVDNCV